jgi:coniferyl-aldehyde dehydrogenase
MDAIADTPISELHPMLARLRAAQAARAPDYAQRRDDLQRLREALKRRLPEMVAALDADFGGRAPQESLLSDGMTTVTEIGYVLRHLRGWMRPKRRGVNLAFLPARAELRQVPLGVVGIMAPWNYPVNLSLIPLIAAIAAGNHVLLKPSEHTPRTALFLRDLLAEVFPADRVAVALGGPELAGAFAALPVDHLFFTGSTALGRKVMLAAAPNLTPLTLELGGKSPALVAPDYPIEHAAERIVAGKCFNAGQTCIAPDYVLLPRAAVREFIERARASVARRYPTLANNSDVTAVVNERQFQRLKSIIEDARVRGVEVIECASAPQDGRRILPLTLLIDPPADSRAMQEELFGPVLPIKPYDDHAEALTQVREQDRPLAFYPFDRDAARLERTLAVIVAGSVCVNDTMVHFAQHALPFGGVGPSGMGHYHGHAGFLALSKAMPVMRQARFNAVGLFDPPYGKVADRLLKLLIR